MYNVLPFHLKRLWSTMCNINFYVLVHFWIRKTDNRADLCVCVSGFIINTEAEYGWTADYFFDIHCQTVIEDDHLLPFVGTSQHKGPVLLCSHIQVQFQLTILRHTKAQSSHTCTALGKEEKTFFWLMLVFFVSHFFKKTNLNTTNINNQ